MSTITLRSTKGSPLTNTEVDANFTNLNTDKYESGNNAAFGTLDASGVALSCGRLLTSTTPAHGWRASLSNSSFRRLASTASPWSAHLRSSPLTSSSSLTHRQDGARTRSLDGTLTTGNHATSVTTMIDLLTSIHVLLLKNFSRIFALTGIYRVRVFSRTRVWEWGGVAPFVRRGIDTHPREDALCIRSTPSSRQQPSM